MVARENTQLAAWHCQVDDSELALPVVRPGDSTPARGRGLPPFIESSISEDSMVDRFEMVTSDSEQVVKRTVDREKALGLSRWFEPTHLAFLLPGAQL